jgi:hypothetical protein
MLERARCPSATAAPPQHAACGLSLVCAESCSFPVLQALEKENAELTEQLQELKSGEMKNLEDQMFSLKREKTMAVQETTRRKSVAVRALSHSLSLRLPASVHGSVKHCPLSSGALWCALLCNRQHRQHRQHCGALFSATVSTVSTVSTVVRSFLQQTIRVCGAD